MIPKLMSGSGSLFGLACLGLLSALLAFRLGIARQEETARLLSLVSGSGTGTI